MALATPQTKQYSEIMFRKDFIRKYCFKHYVVSGTQILFQNIVSPRNEFLKPYLPKILIL